MGAFGTDSFLERPRRKMFFVGFAVRGTVMDTYSGSVPFSPFSMFGIFLNLLSLCPLTAASGLGVFFGLNGISTSNPWAVSFGDLAFVHLERCLGAYPVDFASCWTPTEYWDADDIALEMPDHPNVWTDGSREDFSSLGGFEVAGAGVYLHAPELAFENLVWGTV